MDIFDNPFECGFDKYVDLNSDIVFLGKENLIKIKEKGINKKLKGVKIDSKFIDVCSLGGSHLDALSDVCELCE